MQKNVLIKEIVLKSTNLEITRFIAALLVIFSHAFPITMGNSNSEWLYFITDGQLELGSFAVCLFFLCGGYLTMRSMEHSKGTIKYIVRRFFRIVPVLMFVVVVCIITGAFISTLSFKEYFANTLTYRYLLNGVMILSHNLPGVYEDAVYGPVVNGALWSLPVEFACNVLGAIAYNMNLLSRKNFKFTVPVIAVFGVAVYIFGGRMPVIREILRPCLVFYMGMLYYVYSDKIPTKYYLLAASAVLLVISSLTGLLYIGVVLCVPYIFIFLWFNTKQRFKKVSALGKYAYAMYVWGFPVQQFVAMCFGWNISPYLNALISSAAVVVLAYLTYHLIENPKKIIG